MLLLLLELDSIRNETTSTSSSISYSFAHLTQPCTCAVELYRAQANNNNKDQRNVFFFFLLASFGSYYTYYSQPARVDVVVVVWAEQQQGLNSKLKQITECMVPPFDNTIWAVFHFVLPLLVLFSEVGSIIIIILR